MSGKSIKTKEKNKYAGISTKKAKDGTENIYVRFKYLGKTYSVKNFTKLYGLTTEKKAYDRLQEIKHDISKGKDPFSSTGETLNELYEDRKKTMLNKKDGWRPRTAESYDYFYNAHIRKTIGWKKISKITISDIEDIYDKKLAHVENSTKNQFKRIIRPIFVDQIKKGNIHKNIIDEIETYKMPVKEKLEKRTDEDNIDILRKLYNAVPKYEALSYNQKEEFRNFLMMVILSGHRHGELRQIRIEHCYLDKKMILAPKEITKTKEDYRYPIPDEIIPYLKTIKEGLIFPTIKKGSVDMIFQRLVKLAGIDMFAGKRLSPHDMRRLLMSVMIADLSIDSILADACLSHKQNDVKEHYVSLKYKNIEASYHKYWDFIRNDKSKAPERLKMKIHEVLKHYGLEDKEENINLLESIIQGLKRAY